MFAKSTVSETSKMWSFLKNLRFSNYENRRFYLYGTRLQGRVHKVQGQMNPVHNFTTKLS